MGVHQAHSKAQARKVIKSRRWWRYYLRIWKLCVELGLEYERRG